MGIDVSKIYSTEENERIIMILVGIIYATLPAAAVPANVGADARLRHCIERAERIFKFVKERSHEVNQ